MGASMKIRRASFPRTARDPHLIHRLGGLGAAVGKRERAGTNEDKHVGGEKRGGDLSEDEIVGTEEPEIVDLRPKMKKNKFNKIFKNFYDKW